MKKLILASRFAIPVLAVFLLMPSQPQIADGGANHQKRNLHFGVSGGNVKDISRRFCCSGTLGSLVKDSTGVQYILSNNHVLGLAGSATAGDDVSQPGLIDNGCQVATVVADFTAAPALSSGVDCAIAQLRPGQMDGTGFIEDIGTISSVVKVPTVGLSVAKSGRTTGFQTGTISSINTSVSVKYPTSCGGNNGPVFTFANQVVINSTTFSAGGDSGSLIVTNNSCHQPVALLFAGSSTSTIGNPISLVLTRLSASLGKTVSFVGGTCSASNDFSVGDNGPSDKAIEVATAAMREQEDTLMSKRGVIGVGVSALEKNVSEATIIVYIDVTANVTPKLPKRINGVKVKKVYTEPFVAY
ncbi:MAG TPA: hypothetical protein VNI02_20100 [Blastocatellia bacterium]|nr:hypothetical protein [Blastocatellia bacterium]